MEKRKLYYISMTRLTGDLKGVYTQETTMTLEELKENVDKANENTLKDIEFKVIEDKLTQQIIDHKQASNQDKDYVKREMEEISERLEDLQCVVNTFINSIT